MYCVTCTNNNDTVVSSAINISNLVVSTWSITMALGLTSSVYLIVATNYNSSVFSRWCNILNLVWSIFTIIATDNKFQFISRRIEFTDLDCLYFWCDNKVTITNDWGCIFSISCKIIDFKGGSIIYGISSWCWDCFGWIISHKVIVSQNDAWLITSASEVFDMEGCLITWS